jgi:acetolactate synthase I/II/III large subunit
MNGADLILKAAKANGIHVCFANPGTTEIPLVAAIDNTGGIRAVLCLYEGVCTGAADGYARMLDKPALVVLHLGPGLANGTSNLHNARRAHTPVVTVVGQHSTWHLPFDPPLAMDIEAIASATAGWQRTCCSTDGMSQDMADAISAAYEGLGAVLIVPYDLQMEETHEKIIKVKARELHAVDQERIENSARFLHSYPKTALVLGGKALRRQGLTAAARIKDIIGCDLICEGFPARMERGAGLPDMTRMPYLPEQAMELLGQYDAFIFAGAEEPVAFFGYDGVPGNLLKDGQRRLHIVEPHKDATRSLVCLADVLGAPATPSVNILAQPLKPTMPTGTLSGDKACAVLAALQPEGAIVVDESITNGIWYYPLTAGVPPFSLLTLTGGSLGQGPASAVGAAIACPDRPVINIQADGSAMYTIQALWTQAREHLNVTTLIFSNRSYDILKIELARFGVLAPGPAASRLTDLAGIDWVSLGTAMGVASSAVNTAEDLSAGITKALEEDGPHLIQMNI